MWRCEARPGRRVHRSGLSQAMQQRAEDRWRPPACPRAPCRGPFWQSKLFGSTPHWSQVFNISRCGAARPDLAAESTVRAFPKPCNSDPRIGRGPLRRSLVCRPAGSLNCLSEHHTGFWRLTMWCCEARPFNSCRFTDGPARATAERPRSS